MKTIGALIDSVLVKLHISPSEVTESERRQFLEDFHKIENHTIERTRAARAELTLTLSTGVREYRLPPEVHSIESLIINGVNYTGCRTAPQNLTTG
jgi:hypothetical protein